MNKKIKLITFLSGLSANMALASASVLAQANITPLTYQSGGLGFSDIQSAFSAAVQWGIFFSILVAGLFMIFAGFKYVTAGDDPKKAEGARTMITNAVIGVIVTASVWLLLKVMTMIIPGLDQLLIL